MFVVVINNSDRLQWFALLCCILYAQVTKGSGSVKINGNNLAGTIGVDDFEMKLKWSNIGTLRMYLIQVRCCYEL